MIHIKVTKKVIKLLILLFNANNRARLSSLLGAFISEVDSLGQTNLINGSPYNEKLRQSAGDNKVLLVIHEFSRTGAPYAVLYLARAIEKILGERPVVISPVDGPVRKDFEREGFVTCVDPYLFVYRESNSDACGFIGGFDLVIVTSMCSYGFIRFFRGVGKKIIWWLHEVGENMESLARREDFQLLTYSCDQIWFGSPLCSSPVFNKEVKGKINTLFYGCPDKASSKDGCTSDKIIFTLFGSVDYRKGQDIFVQAIEKLPLKYREKSIFRIIGSPVTSVGELFYKKIKGWAVSLPEIEFYKNMPLDELEKYYKDANVFVSSSRADPMPIVITQGLMYSKVCLCSSAIGQAQLIRDGENGLVFESGSIEGLTDKIIWVINNVDKQKLIGLNGRNVYEKYFEESMFVERVKKLLGIGNSA